MSLLEIHNLNVEFKTRHETVKAVQNLSLTLKAGETLGLVGESGSGKSVTCLSLLGLLPSPPASVTAEKIQLDDLDLTAASPKQLRRIRGKRMSMIFQNPMTSLNPYLKISTQLTEPLLVHEKISRKAAFERAVSILGEVGIPDAASRIHAYPHEYSGGMRQRAMIAMALITGPEVLLADEPTTALDVTVQAQILDLINRMQTEFGTAVIFVTHDLGVVSEFCDRVAVMYGGRLLETGTTEDIFNTPQHPYTQALQQALPALEANGNRLFSIPGEPPDLSNPPPGCPFAPRCRQATEACQQSGNLRQLGTEHYSACILARPGKVDQ